MSDAFVITEMYLYCRFVQNKKKNRFGRVSFVKKEIILSFVFEEKRSEKDKLQGLHTALRENKNVYSSSIGATTCSTKGI